MVLDLQHGRKVYDYLGRHPRLYRFIRRVAGFGREAMLQERTIQAARLKAGDTVLDLACGNGANLADLQRAVGPAGRIIALDYSAGMLDHAKARARSAGWRNIEFIQGDAARMNLADASLDGAVCTFALSAMPGEAAAVARVAAALKAGGRFVALDAKRLGGAGRVLNPIVGPFFAYTTNWDDRKDVIGAIRAAFEQVDVTEFHAGGNYIAVATKEPALRSRRQV